LRARRWRYSAPTVKQRVSMQTRPSLIKRYPTWIYFILAFAITWGGVLLLGGAFPNTKEEFASLQPRFIPAVLGGPSVAGMLLIAVLYGARGFRELAQRISRWRVSAGWYAIALVVGPLVLIGVMLALSAFSEGFLPSIFLAPDKVSLLIGGIVAGLVVGFFEELGWTGFAIPRLRLRYGVFATGLIVGVLWGGWHVFLNAIYVSRAYSAGLPPTLFVAARGLGDMLGLLPAFRVLMVWVYDRTGSLLVVMLMHAGLTATTIITDAPGMAGAGIVVYDIVSALAMWAVVGIAALALRGEFSRSMAVGQPS
jgi:membrane protease YdiL (CAAX protease family)